MPTEKDRIDRDKKKTSKTQSQTRREQSVDGRNVKQASKESTEARRRRDDSRSNKKTEISRHRNEESEKKASRDSTESRRRRDDSRSRKKNEIEKKIFSKDATETKSRRDDSRSNNKTEIPRHRKDRHEESDKKTSKRDPSVDKMKKSRSYHETRTDSINRISRTHRTKDDGTGKVNISHSIERNGERKHHRSSDLPPERKRSDVVISDQKKKSIHLNQIDDKARINLKSKNEIKSSGDDVEVVEDNYDEVYDDDFEEYDSDFESDEDAPDAEDEVENEIKNDTDSVLKNFETKTFSAPLKMKKIVNFVNSFTGFTNPREKENVLLAINAENEFVKEFKLRDRAAVVENKAAGNTDNQKSALPSNFINFSSARERQTARSALNKSVVRKIELFDSNRISMNEMYFDIFDLPPVDYEVYIKSFGRSNAKQIYCQTNDDNVTEEIQTDDLESTEKWTQHPALGRWSSGGNAEKNLDAQELENLVKNDSVRLSKFIQSAGEVVISLLEETMNETDKENKYDKTKMESSFSIDSYQLGEVPFRKGCPVTFVQFSMDEPHMLLTIHAAAEDELVEDLPELGVICVWNIFQPLFPQKILSSHSQPLCCCFNPGKANLTFAGLVDGSVLLWDLREPSNIHRKIAYDGHDFILRTSTYSTAEILREESHRSSVVSIRSMQMDTDFFVSSSSNYSEQQLTFRVASLEEYGVIKLWTCIEVAQPDVSGSDADLGLSPGSRIRLIRSQTINLHQFSSMNLEKRKNLRSLDLQFLPNDCNHMFIATDMASVLHCDSDGTKVSPAIFKSDELCQVKSLVFCDWTSPVCFLAGCSNGTIRLHSVNKGNSLVSWPNVTEGEIVSISWAGNGSFYVLDSASRIHFWDLHKNQFKPVLSQIFDKHKVIYFHTNGGKDSGRKLFQIAVAFDNGAVEIHQIPSTTRPDGPSTIPLDLI